MSTTTKATTRITSVAIEPNTEAAELYRSARVAGFPAEPSLNLRRFAGKTLGELTFTHIYLGGAAAWSSTDVERIDWALPAAMEDTRLNNVLAQYFPDGKLTSTFKPSRFLEGRLPERVYRDTLEDITATLERSDVLSGFELASTVFCLLLPRDVVLVDGTSTDRTGVDSKHGLGGYHGSIHPKHGRKVETVYYAVAAYSVDGNGIAVFPEGWKNTCAVFYHELCEARTDPDVEDAIRAGNAPHADDFLGWYSPQGGEIGDIPLEEAGASIGAIVTEVALGTGGKKVPVQLMWSNAVAGPEGPIARKHSVQEGLAKADQA
jgi:hypothetical protein